MNLYRCAACGSSKVFTEEKSEGYSIAKGAIGTALFGTGGAVMGVNGKSNVYYHCAECGQTLSYTMPESVKKAIDDAIANPEIYITFLKSQKEHYPNIEWNETFEDCNNCNEIAKKRWYEYTADEQANLIWSYYQKSKISYIEDAELLKALGFENEFIDIQTMDILKKRGLMTVECKNNKLYYTFYEKTEDIKNNIDEYERKEQIEKQIKEIWQENREKLKNATIELLRKENINNEIEEKIFNKKIKELIESEIKETDYNVLCGYDELIKKISSNLQMLLMYPKNNLDAYVVPSHSKEGYFQILLDDNERENYIKNREKIRLEKEYGEYIEEIKKLLNENEKMTITEMQNESNLLCECSNQRISAIIGRCDEFEKILDGKRVYFAMHGTKEKLEEEKKKEQEEIEQYNKEVEKNNANINNKIADIYKEIKKENEIIELNKYKFFGDGAKAKSEAKVRITKLEGEIRNLKSQLKEKK